MAEPDAGITLQPHNRTPFVEAVSLAIADAWRIPVEILSTIWDPWTCPAGVLPFVARAVGVELWRDDWPEAKQRSVVAAWPGLSRRKGVEPTFEAMLGIMDARMVEFLAPPQGLFPRAHWTSAEAAAWRAQFPEIRVYPRRNRHTSPRNLLVVGQPWFGSRRILRKSVAADYAGARATYVKNGVETPIALRVDTGAGAFARGLNTVALPTTERRLVLPCILGHGHFVPRASTAAARVFRFGAGAPDGGAGPYLLPPGQPLSVLPDRVCAPHVRPGGFVVGHCLPMVLRSSVASDFIYDSIRINDPSVAITPPPPRKGGWILGRSKLRQKPFLVHLTADLSRVRPGGFVVGHTLPMILRKADPSRLQDGLAAVRAAKLGRDKIMVRTDLHRPITFGDGVPLDGSFRLGQIVERLN